MGGEVRSAFGSMDTLGAQRLQSLQWVQQSRLSHLSRSLAEASAQYPPDSEEVKTAQAAVDATTATVGRVSMAHLQSATSDPEVTQEGWALHGRVFDDAWNPLSGYTVFLVDSEKIYQQALGFSYSDDTGYFLINYPGPQSAAKGQKATASAAQSEPAPQLFLQVANRSSQPVFLSETAFKPAVGSATYQNVLLAAGAQPIGDPPAEIRDVALPRGTRRAAAPRKRK
jgi:hypothetical protein